MKKTYVNQDSCLDQLFADESLFSISNGIIGLRNTIAEGVPEHITSHPGFYFNGIYTTYPYKYGEKGHGFPDYGQVIVNLPQVDILYAEVEGVPLNAVHATIVHCERELDTKTGIVSRETTYETKSGQRFIVTDKRIAPDHHPHTIIIEYSVRSETYSGQIELVSKINTTTTNYTRDDDPRVLDLKGSFYTVNDINQRHLHIVTTDTLQHIHISFKHKEPVDQKVVNHEMVARLSVSITPDKPVSTTKYIVVTASTEHINPRALNREILAQYTNQTITDFIVPRISPIDVDDSLGINEIIQYNLYQLEHSGGLSDRYSIPAKGLSGEGYEGHYFWDTEMYMVPYFLYTKPEQAKNLLLYRYNGLKFAKEEARKLGHPNGAKYPWRTINGQEVSPYFPAGTAQYHINAIIAYQFIQYYWVTKDVDFLLQYGFEVLYETALIYLEIGNFVNGQFHIFDVTGPDEYTAIVNDNYYTNSMAKFHIEQTVSFYHQFQKRLKGTYSKQIIQTLEKAANNMVLLYDKSLNINPQDESFLRKPRIDMEGWRRPLLLHYHPLTIYRHQVCKQADVIASHMLLNNVSKDVMKDSVNYYEQVTTHDSSLSKCIFSIQHAFVGQIDFADLYFQEQLKIDVDNTYHNTGHGLHMANLGGTYLVLLYGFLGLRVMEDELSIQPTLPEYITRLTFRLTYQGRQLTIDITTRQIHIVTTGTLTMNINDITYLIHNETTVPRS